MATQALDRMGGAERKQDNAYAVLLWVDQSKLQGLSLTAHTGRALMLNPTKFRLLTEVSADGVHLQDTIGVS